MRFARHRNAPGFAILLQYTLPEAVRHATGTTFGKDKQSIAAKWRMVRGIGYTCPVGWPDAACQVFVEVISPWI